MTDDHDLAGLDPYDLMATEADRLARYFAGLDDAAWSRATGCEGWSVRDLLAHLTASEDYNRACLDGTVGAFLASMGERGVTDLASANEVGIRDLDGLATSELLATWRTRANENREAFRARDGSDVDSSVGPYSARWQAFHLAFELAIHADDVGAPVADGEAASRTQWLAQFGRFALKETKPDTETEAHDGRTRVRGGGLEVDLPDADFVLAAAGRAAGDPALDDAARSYLAVT
jgi:uncharacterized protein (TIGR03083 family)